MWLLLLYVALAGGAGGVVNALMTDKGFLLPTKETVDTLTIFRPGWIGNVIIGALAAVISWGLYGPLASYTIAGTAAAVAASNSSERVGLALSSLVGAALVGVAGARWLTNEVDKSLLRAAAVKAADAPGSPAVALQMAVATPLQALDLARAMR